MSTKRPGWRAAERRYNYLTADIKRKARDEVMENHKKALRLCLQEIEQFHRTAYPDCEGFCPAHEAMAAARKQLTPTL